MQCWVLKSARSLARRVERTLWLGGLGHAVDVGYGTTSQVLADSRTSLVTGLFHHGNAVRCFVPDRVDHYMFDQKCTAESSISNQVDGESDEFAHAILDSIKMFGKISSTAHRTAPSAVSRELAFFFL